MPFTITETSASNKPPQPDHPPSATLFPTKKHLRGDRTAWISVPQPDRLAILIPITAGVYGSGFSEDVPVGEFLKSVGDYLKHEPHNAHVVDYWYDPNKGGVWKWIRLSMGGRSSSVHFQFPKKAEVGASFRVELNPRKLGPSGFKHLANVLSGRFNVPAAVAVARIARLDIAVDVVGLAVWELMAWHKDQGKRSMYIGPDGLLETLYIHRKLPPKKQKVDSSNTPKKVSHGSQPAGKVLLKVYDRVREREAVLKPPPFGPAPVTRVELVVTTPKKWAALKDLPAMDDRFTKVRVGFRDSQVTVSDHRWRTYVAAQRTLQPEVAVSLTKTGTKYKTQYIAAAAVPDADIIAPSKNWADWHVGLKATGLLWFVELAD